MKNTDKIIGYKFKATLGNIYDSSDKRTRECEASSWNAAIDKFNGFLYKTIGDRILSIEIVGLVVEAKEIKPINV